MTANKTRFSLITLILTVALMFSLLSVSVFAETESGVESTPVATESVAESTPAESNAESTPAESTPATSTTTGATAEEEKDIVGTIVSLSILAVIIIVVAIVCIIKREKVGKFFRSLKSEFKKVVWLSWEQVRKNTIVVIIVVVIVSVVIGLLDVAFNQGIINLGKLVK